MSVTLLDYVQRIGLYYPTVRVACFGDPFVYENLRWEGGDPLPSKTDLDTVGLLDAKKNKVAALSLDCQDAILSGYISSALGSPHKYDAENVDQINILGATQATAPTPDAPQGYSMEFAVRPVVDGVYQAKFYTPHTHAQLRQVLMDGALYKLTCLQKFNTKRDYVNITAQTLEQINAVTWESNP